MDRGSQGCDRSVPPPPGSVKDESRQFLKISLCCEIHTPITLTEGALHPSSLQLYSAPPSSSPSAGSTGGGSTGSPAASSWSGDICKPANISFARQTWIARRGGCRVQAAPGCRWRPSARLRRARALLHSPPASQLPLPMPPPSRASQGPANASRPPVSVAASACLRPTATRLSHVLTAVDGLKAWLLTFRQQRRALYPPRQSENPLRVRRLHSTST